jgi:hypothetical protein
MRKVFFYTTMRHSGLRDNAVNADSVKRWVRKIVAMAHILYGALDEMQKVFLATPQHYPAIVVCIRAGGRIARF